MPPASPEVCCTHQRGCIHWAQLHCLANSRSPSSIKFEPSDSSVIATGFSWKYHVCHLSRLECHWRYVLCIYIYIQHISACTYVWPVICQLWQLEWKYIVWGMERNSHVRVLTVRLVPSLSVFLCVILEHFGCIWSFFAVLMMVSFDHPKLKISSLLPPPSS